MPSLNSHHAARLAAALKSLKAKDYQAAHKQCMAVLAEAPATPRAFHLLARIAGEHDNPGKALEVNARALRLDPQNPEYLAYAGQLSLALNRQADAHRFAVLALEAGPDHALLMDQIGVIFSRTADHERALPCFEAARQGAPDVANIAYNLGSARQFLGQFDAAGQDFEAAIALQGDHYRAHSALSQLHTQTAEHNHLERLSALFDALGSHDVEGRLHIGHAMAKELEDLDRFPESLAWLIRGKAAKRDQVRHDPQTDAALFDAASQTITHLSEAAVTAQAPVFVVGMPRTGTTLVDRMLSSHPDVVSIGESTQFALLLKRATRTASAFVLDAETLRAAAHMDVQEVGTGYLDATRRLARGHASFIDKMPLNFFYTALILRALPGARVICLRRNPMDTCLSNYRQLFATSFSYYNYAYDLAHTAHFYSRFAALMDHFETELPASRFMQVRYEDLVTDFGPTARRLIEFCGLDWVDDITNFHRNTAPVATASSVQVRQPLYTRAMARWKRYGDALNPLKAALAANGVIVEA